VSTDIARGLAALLGDGAVLTAPGDLEPYLVDHRRLYHGATPCVVRPRSVDEISKLLGWCSERRIGVVPQGGNTSYCGGATPDESGTQVVLSLARLDRVRHVDAADFSMTVEAGVTLANAQRAADDADRFFPLALGSEGTCQVGGNLSTNAGGVNVLRYGMMRELVLGLEVVLADGRVLDLLTRLRKDNTGYDVKSLFLGAEGTLGVITAASLRLFPKIRASATAFAAVPDVQAAVSMLGEMRTSSGDRLSSFELIPRAAIAMTVANVPGTIAPLDGPQPWYVLCELTSSSTDDRLDERLEATLAGGMERGLVLDAVLARSERDRRAFWAFRENIPEGQRRAGASLKHDVSVPVSQLPRFVELASRAVAQLAPEHLLIAYGHVGDGNLHFNVSQGPGTDRARFLALEPALKRAVHDVAKDLGGSFSAEHGIGRLKVGELERYAPPVELELMRAVKRAFDPNGIMNPGKVLSHA
jgi:FAD/FMN-containing dehydrogenase